MQITIVHNDQVINVEIDGNESIDTLKAIVEAETNVPAASMQLIHNGNPLLSNNTVSGHGVQGGDLVMLMVVPQSTPSRPRPSSSQGTGPTAMNPDGSAADPEGLMAMLRAGPQLDQLPRPLADAIRTNNVSAFQDQLRTIASERRKAQEEEERFMRMAAEDPFNIEVQRKLEELIQKKNVAENFEQALEHNPEAFADVIMLYVNMEVNGVPLKAFIDSGAQSTIMSKSCAERCGLLRLMDTRFSGMARGVGTAKILGKIHMVPMKAGNSFFPVSITVLEQEAMEFLFGLDNLKRHQCSIDLKANLLRFGSSETALPFLAEHEIPKSELFHGEVTPSPSVSQQPVPASAPTLHVPTAAQPTTAPPPAATNNTAGGAMPAGWEEKIQRLMALGFGRDQCLAALRTAQGNEELAGSMLFGAF